MPSVADWDTERLAQFRNRQIGFVFQFHHLLPEFSAIENVMIPVRMRRLGPVVAREQAKNGWIAWGSVTVWVTNPANFRAASNKGWLWLGPS